MHTSEWPRVNANVVIALDSGITYEGIVRRVGSIFIVVDRVPGQKVVHISKRHISTWWETE